ncbi:MAG: hypothetical protein IKR63_01015 [Alloprevotella sp.]|nr:hypothetical protein [Alloprevotella sp.]
MKKLFLISMVLLASSTFVSCGNKSADGEQAADSTATAQVAEDGNKFEGKNFSLVYPKDFEETYASDESLNAECKGEKTCHLDATYNDMGPALSELETYATNWKGMKEANGCKIVNQDIKDKVLTIKSTKDDETEIHYVVMKEDKIGVAGSLKFKTADEATYEPVLQGIIKSISFK